MLVMVMVLTIVAAAVVLFSRRDALSLYLCGLALSIVVMFSGAITYIAKMGGFSDTQRVFLFLVPKFQTWLQYLPVSLGRIGYLVALGRCMFPYFLLMIAMELPMIYWVRLNQKALRLWSLIPPVLFLIYYYPIVFKTIVDRKFWLLVSMRSAAIVWINIYIIASLILLIIEYRSTTIPYYKRNFSFIMLSQFSITMLYGMYAVQDPGQIYNLYISEYIKMGSFFYFKSSMNGYGWIGVGLSTIFFVIAGTISLIYYTRLNYLEDQQDIILERKFDAASAGISVFVHSIKNQLLASRVLNKKLMQELAKEHPCLNEVNAYAIKLNEMNESTLDHLNELYKSAKSNTLSMKPEPVSLIAEKSEMLFSQKYPDSSVIFELENPRQMVLADITHLSEAIYNLLINGYEAAVQAGREAPEVKLIIHNERLWTVFEIKDNGIGIPRSKQLKIFEPFYTSKNTNYNWGMGLYYVRKIVKGHLGKLRVESSGNKGTSIFILLPKLSSGI
jgi:hypothetical protein